MPFGTITIVHRYLSSNVTSWLQYDITAPMWYHSAPLHSFIPHVTSQCAIVSVQAMLPCDNLMYVCINTNYQFQ